MKKLFEMVYKFLSLKAKSIGTIGANTIRVEMGKKYYDITITEVEI